MNRFGELLQFLNPALRDFYVLLHGFNALFGIANQSFPDVSHNYLPFGCGHVA